MTSTTEDFCNEKHFTFITQIWNNLLTPPIFMSYLFAILLQYLTRYRD